MRLSGLTSIASKRCFILLTMLSVSLFAQTTLAARGALFHVLATGSASNLSITLCLNGKGPLSCQNYNVSALNLSISTTILNHTYPTTGIRINTPGYSLEGCTPISNGYCLFSTSNTMPAMIKMNSNLAVLTPSVPSMALVVHCPPATIGCVHTNDALTGNPRQITIRNNSSAPARNISVTPSGFPVGTSITSPPCSSTLNPSDSCLIVITPGKIETENCSNGTVPMNGKITVSSDDAPSVVINVAVLSYGCIYQGGYLYSVNDGTVTTGSIGGKVAAQFDQATPNSSGVIWSSDHSGIYDGGVSLWGIDDSSTTISPSPNASTTPDPATQYSGQLNCIGAINGVCNTNNIYLYYSTIASLSVPLSYYAAGRCKETISGYSDWYLPSICEMGPDSGGLICDTVQVEQNMVDNLPILLNNCSGPQCLANDYWSSTELTGNPLDIAWDECFAPGANSSQCVENKSEALGVRCSRVF